MKSNIRGCFLSFVLALGCVSASHGQIVKDVVARQRYPWNNLVDIDYTIENMPDNGAYEIEVKVEDRTTGQELIATAFDKEPSFQNGRHRITWNPLKDHFPFGASCMVVYRVTLVSNPYMVIDLSSGVSSSSYPVSYLSRPPAGGWGDEYKTRKLVLRRIRAGSFIMGSPEEELGRWDDEVQRKVTLTHDFYAGIFEVTQGQWERVMGSNPSAYLGDARPVEKVNYDMIRGSSAGSGWPGSSAVDAESFMGRLRARCMDCFDLPTEAQWEYACRAGTTTALNSGEDITTEEGRCPNLDELGRYCNNGGGNEGHAVVGSYRPNAWGLYDMHGNVCEWCLDWYSWYGAGEVIDPRGAVSGSYRVLRGGSWGSDAQRCRSASRRGDFPSRGISVYGFRLFRILPAQQTSEAGGSRLRTFEGVQGDGFPAALGLGSSDCPSACSASVRMESVESSRWIRPGISRLIAYSPCWDGETGGSVTLSMDGMPFFFSGEEGVCTWTPDQPGVYRLSCTWGTKRYETDFIVHAISVKDIVARQRYPWSLAVDIDYTLENVPGIGYLSLSVIAEDLDTGKRYAARHFVNRPLTRNGRHRITWLPPKDNIPLNSERVAYEISLQGHSMYQVIDLSGGPSSPFYPVSYLNDIPAGGWSDEYKTKKLVLRRIPFGTFMMGSPADESGRIDDETQHEVCLTRDFYMGVFEMTQEQWSRVMGNDPSGYDGNTRPVENVSYDMIRGDSSGTNWPSSSIVDASSFMGRLRSRTGMDTFDLPTEAQWEYACRADTTSALNNGKGISSQNGNCPYLNELGRYQFDRWDGRGEYEEHTTVGSYTPNAWGLYDMHGNVWEWCLDWYGEYKGEESDPSGAKSGSERILRGGGWDSPPKDCCSARRCVSEPTRKDYIFGFRLTGNTSVELEKPGHEKSVLSFAFSKAVPMTDEFLFLNTSLGSKHRLTYSDHWGKNGGSCTILENGVEIFHGSGEGYFEWTPSGVGERKLTHLVGNTKEIAFFDVPLPADLYDWIDSYWLASGNDDDAYIAAANGTAANGLSVLDCYIASLDPTVPYSRLTARIKMVDGKPHITWVPYRKDRVYTIEGREFLDSGEWNSPPPPNAHFFRVRVSYPEPIN